MLFLVFMAVLPVIVLCYYIYFKDQNKEPKGLLALIFFLGFISVIPVVICELIFEVFFPEKLAVGTIPIFIHVFFGVALIEEFFKWLIAKFLGYHNKAFDEVYDIIVYSVFASLGFACFENIVYVSQNGFGNAIMRALLAIPGHTCFAISMGFFLSKAKVGQINGNHNIYVKNTLLSILVPVILHTFYDGLLMIVNGKTDEEVLFQMIPFLVFDILMVIVCFITVNKTAKVQQNLSLNIANGNIARNDQGVLYYNYQNAIQNQNATPNTVNSINQNMPQGNVVPSSGTVPPSNTFYPQNVVPQELLYCPICGKPAKGLNYCGGCGFKLK